MKAGRKTLDESMVGVTGFEPATYTSRTDLAALLQVFEAPSKCG